MDIFTAPLITFQKNEFMVNLPLCSKENKKEIFLFYIPSSVMIDQYWIIKLLHKLEDLCHELKLVD